MKEILYAPDKILINEGDLINDLILLKEGKLETFSNFCSHSSIETKGIFGSEMIVSETKSFESIRVIENSRVIHIEKELVEKFLLSNSHLIIHLIQKYIIKLISLNNKIFGDTLRKSGKNENTIDKNLTKEDLSKKYLKKVRRKNFYHINDEQLITYRIARSLFNHGKIKEALNEFKKIQYTNFGVYFQAEIETWKYLCMILIYPEKKYYLEKTLKEKYPFIKELFSFMIFESIITNMPLSKPLITYLKSGYLIPANTVLFYEGEEGDWAFMILTGNVRVSQFTPSGERLLAILSNEEVVGEISCFKEVQRTATVFTSTPLQGIIIEKNNLDELVNSNPAFGLKIVKNLIKRLDFERFWHSPLSFEEKLNFMINKYGKNILNKSQLKIEEIRELFRISNKKNNELINYLFKSNIATLRADGTLKFM
ncbi:Cyclic nucleotide-binding domain-containing protein [Marinitoga hydrogenitolerans DSM 16785]|uniref:Cyclic nucleotide-binding domain-containing protein n=1 Tax=Marinitoga hydrogenitolerans (strain DSM 16785 / JCM 12826 / AT1271) TaxID=1122195 RepID=A0A1M4XL97_MARH1|nr:cyclic nucleotide-binding domain-containing protein [Marinitoga hydrogenitolerans]SHE94196.1 Cyclic nucleotide-binding domain-containing protein [Marinitoga hydrogenitolerans DSM 16785]